MAVQTKKDPKRARAARQAARTRAENKAREEALRREREREAWLPPNVEQSVGPLPVRQE